jgi:hypothetical protein
MMSLTFPGGKQSGSTLVRKHVLAFFHAEVRHYQVYFELAWRMEVVPVPHPNPPHPSTQSCATTSLLDVAANSHISPSFSRAHSHTPTRQPLPFPSQLRHSLPPPFPLPSLSPVRQSCPVACKAVQECFAGVDKKKAYWVPAILLSAPSLYGALSVPCFVANPFFSGPISHC